MRDYRPAWWLPGPHLPTLWAARGRPGPAPTTRPERLELPDGDFVDLAWGGASQGPLVLILHGLEGSQHSPYARRLMAATARRGWGACLMHFRGCSGTPNRLARSYHSGDTADFNFLVRHLREREPLRPLLAVGYSVGGNVLLKWLGEQGGAAGLGAAAVVSVPFDLAAAAERLTQGFSRIYQAHLLASLNARVRRKLELHALPVTRAELAGLRTFRDYDERVTAPLHGFTDADDYYARASSRPYLGAIRTPTLILHARNDPFLPSQAIPSAAECPVGVRLELPAQGGHVGFVTDPVPWRQRPWLENHLLDFLATSCGSATAGSR